MPWIGRPAATTPASPDGALPVVTFTEDVTFHINGDVLHAFHVENAHTDGDAIVHFEGANVVHMGDHMFMGMFPFVDLEHGAFRPAGKSRDASLLRAIGLGLFKCDHDSAE